MPQTSEKMKCPYCGEEILAVAKKCRFCGEWLRKEKPKKVKDSSNKVLIFIIIIGLVLMVIFGFLRKELWYLYIPLFLIWFLYARMSLKNSYKLIISALLLIAGFVLFWANFNVVKEPEISITSPQDKQVIEGRQVTIDGKVNPPDSELKITYQDGDMTTDKDVPVKAGGSFSYTAKFANEGFNNFRLTATKDYKASTSYLLVKHSLSEEEKNEVAQKKAEEDRKKAEEAEKKQKEQEEIEKENEKYEADYKNSGAEGLCKKHTNWTEQECYKVAKKLVWIGMTYEMLVEERGKPNSINPSNYGEGNQYQYCWYYNTPRCFYDDNDDEIMDSYN